MPTPAVIKLTPSVEVTPIMPANPAPIPGSATISAIDRIVDSGLLPPPPPPCGNVTNATISPCAGRLSHSARSTGDPLTRQMNGSVVLGASDARRTRRVRVLTVRSRAGSNGLRACTTV